MKAVAKFLFDNSFDVESPKPRDVAAERPAPAPEPVVEAPPPPPTYGAAELAAAREEGRAQGVAEGEAAAAAAAAQTRNDALAAIRDLLPGIAHEIDEGAVMASRFMLETTIAGLRRLMPELNRRGGLAEIEGLLQETMSHLRDEARIVVRLHDGLLDALRADLDATAQAAGFEGKLVLLAETDIAPGDCRIEWADGGVERAADRIWSDIEAAMMRAIAATPAGTPAGRQESMTAGSGTATPQEN